MVERPLILAGVMLAAMLAGCIAAPDDAQPADGPVARIEASATDIALGAPVIFNGTRSEGPRLDYTWDFGDGAMASGPVATHTYEATGNHTVSLTVTDPSGASANATLLVSVDDGYMQEVWFNWGKTQLDVLILGVADPVIGASIQEAIDAWEIGITELAPELGAALEFRVYWPVTGLVPPLDFSPDIYFVPAGFMAAADFPTDGTCTAFAPAGYIGPEPLDQEELYFTAAHEFGHCLGLSHVFYKEVEYEPAFDLLGGGSVHRDFGKSCPSNLNIELLRMVFNGDGGQVLISKADYHQASAC